MGASNISAPISHLTWRRVAASKNRHLLGNSTTGDVKTTCFYRQNVRYKWVGARQSQGQKNLRWIGQFGAHLADQIGLTRTQGVNHMRLRGSDSEVKILAKDI